MSDVETYARVMFEDSPVSRGAKPWILQPEGGRVKEQFRAEAAEYLKWCAVDDSELVPWTDENEERMRHFFADNL